MTRAILGIASIAVVLTACSGGAQNTSSLIPSPGAMQTRSRSVTLPIKSLKAPHVTIPRYLYIADLQVNAVYVLRNKTYRDVGGITSGIDYPTDVFLDKQGNLYVANRFTPSVTEYAPKNLEAPSFTYTAGMSFPTVVTSDRHGNLYEGDISSGLNEYFQGINYAVLSCPTPYAILGIAVDSKGEVFAELATTYGPPFLVELPSGLSNCSNGIALGAAPTAKGGIALDSNGNLLVADGANVDVIAPPYGSITRTIGSGFTGAVSVHLNKTNTRAFVTDASNRTVTVVSYPSGTNLTVLGSSNGLVSPVASVDALNAVY